VGVQRGGRSGVHRNDEIKKQKRVYVVIGFLELFSDEISDHAKKKFRRIGFPVVPLI
jgi:hypothetical protein